MNKQNVFGRSRLRLMLRYALVMGGLVIVLLFAMHKTMEWAITSEQARELMCKTVVIYYTHKIL